MKTALCAIILLVAVCFVEVESQCQGHVADSFSAFYVRVVRIGEDNYEQYDEGDIVNDGIGRRYVVTPNSNSQFPQEIQKEYVCYNMDTRMHERIIVLPNGDCETKSARYFEIEVPSIDNYKGQIKIGGTFEYLDENVYAGRDSREWNEMLLTTTGCGPTFFFISSDDNNYRSRMQLFNLKHNIPMNAFTIVCNTANGSQSSECGAEPPSL